MLIPVQVDVLHVNPVGNAFQSSGDVTMSRIVMMVATKQNAAIPVVPQVILDVMMDAVSIKNLCVMAILTVKTLLMRNVVQQLALKDQYVKNNYNRCNFCLAI